MTSTGYDAIDAVRWSHLKHMRISPKHYRHQLLQPWRDTPAMLLGRAIDCLVLHPDRWQERFAIWDGGRRAGSAWRDFCAEWSGHDILKPEEAARARAAAAAVLSHPDASRLLSGGVTEPVLRWTDDETGIECKGKPDVAGDVLVDLKSTGIIDPHRFESHAWRLGYVGQLAYYRAGIEANGGSVAAAFLVVAEAEEPHDVLVYEVPPDTLAAGRRLYRRLLRQLRECLDADSWPGIAPERLTLNVPAWADDELAQSITMGGVELF